MVKAESNRWKEVRRSEFPWEREALDFVREGLPEQEPFRAWSNFEFVPLDGGVYEVDLLVLTNRGMALIEIKSRPGVLSGDSGTWTWRKGGSVVVDDNPLLLASRKAKKLRSLLQATKAFEAGVPWIEPMVFLSSAELDCRLEGAARNGVLLRDRADRPGIRAELLAPATDPKRPPIDRRVARALVAAMEKAGIRPSESAARIGDYQPKELLFEGKGYQDFSARHPSFPDVHRRLRIYAVARDAGRELRETVARAARREFEILQGIDHPGILKALEYREDPRGAVLVFDHDPAALRLDHFLAENGPRLTLDQRLDLFRRIAEALRYAHGRRLFHRALSPASILVRPRERGATEVKLFNWQTAAREIETTSGGGRSLLATSHLEVLVDDAAIVYLAPESLNAEVGEDAAALDVFSLGAIGYHLFAGRPPASGFDELQDRLREGGALQLTGAVEGASEGLRELIAFSTRPEVETRVASVDEVLSLLDLVEDALTKPEPDFVTNPTEARPGERLEGGFVVVKSLGRGSSAVVFVVRRGDEEHVLKLALTPELNPRLRAEAATLRILRHPHIVALHDEVEIGGHVGLLLEPAGDQTLGARLRTEGRLTLDLLQRFGEDLLQVVQYLEEQGVSHRDLKPDNIGIAQRGKKDALRLVLFDFSLAATPAEELRAGTRPYLDPFFAGTKPPRRRFDTAAERWSAAVTLHEMATGALPVFGDGRSDPAVLSAEATIDAELFDAPVREGLRDFFTKALRRDARERFDNAEEMLVAWRSVFARLDRPAFPTDHGEDAEPVLALDGAALDTPLAALGLSTRALNALERIQALRVQDLLRIPEGRLLYLRGVGNKTRRELIRVLKELATRFPDSRVVEPPPDTGDLTSVDLLASALLPAPSQRKKSSEAPVLAAWLGLGDETGFWPAAAKIATDRGVTAARIHQILGAARARFADLPALAEAGDELHELLGRKGGIATAHELATALLALRGSSAVEPQRTRHALAVVRAATEVERSSATPRFVFRRAPRTALIARVDLGGDELLGYALRLGAEADALAESDPLPSAARAQEVLSKFPTPPDRPPLPPQTVLRLAALASAKAALSPRFEIYPCGMPAERALKLAHGALLGEKELTPAQIRERVLGRFPESGPLPDPPALVALLQAAGSPLEWDAAAAKGHGAFRLPEVAALGLSSASTAVHRRVTDLGAPPAESIPVADARLFEQRLDHAVRHGSFLVLLVDPRFLPEAEAELRRRFAAELELVDVEARLLAAMRSEADKARVAFDLVLAADAAPPTSRDFQNLLRLVGRAVASFEAALDGEGRTLLLVRPGLLARYDQLGLLERLRDRIGVRATAAPGPLHGAWVLVPTDDQHELPVLDGREIPVLTRNQWARIPLSWIENLHRTRVPASPAERP